MENIKIDLKRESGKIKPLHGVNNGPVTGTFRIDHINEYREAGIPFVRLHDTEGAYGGSYYVDIPNIFRDFDKDPKDPEAYDFDLTDLYIQKIYESGAEAFYRLGVTIDHAPVKKRTAPPKDYKKWAEICEGIIRHYNEGWANGFHFGIKYWEIWNEPENHPDPALNPMWGGSDKDYFRLYEIAANHLKDMFPDIKIGGYGHCGFYAVTRPDATGPREQYFMDFMFDFLEYISSEEHKSPLDFFSWHIYSPDINEIEAFAVIADKALEKYGFTETENILNEWNYRGISKEVKSMTAAAWVAGTFCMLQKTNVSSGMYYDAMPSRMSYCGLFSYPDFGIEKPYYSFKAFNELFKLKTEVYSECGNDDIRSLAAYDGNQGAVLISRYNIEIPDFKRNITFDITGYPIGGNRNIDSVKAVTGLSPVPIKISINGLPPEKEIEVYVINELKNLEPTGKIRNEGIIEVEPQSVILLKF